MVDAPSSADAAPAPSPVRTFLSATMGRLTVALAAILAAAIVSTMTDMGAWLGGRAADLRDRLVRPVVAAMLEEQLAEPSSPLRLGISDTFESLVSDQAGTIAAGSFVLSEAKRTHVIPFYLPPGHVIELTMRLQGLDHPGEVVRITYVDPTVAPSELTFDFVYSFEVTLPDADEIAAQPAPTPGDALGTQVTTLDLGGHTRHYFPLTISLAFSEEAVTGASDGAGARLRSEVYVEFVGLLSPPVRRDVQ